MKIIFMLDMVDEKGNVIAENARSLELTPDKLQLRESKPGITWLCMPCDKDGNYVKGETQFTVNLVPFPGAKLVVEQAPAPTGPAPVVADTKPAKKAKAAKKVN